MELIVFAILMALYFTLHSLLADEGLKRFFHQKLISEKWYRLFYNLISIVFLFPLAVYFFQIEKEKLFDFTGKNWLGLALVFYGIYWTLRAMKGYDLNEFLGFAQMEGKVENEHKYLNTSGLNAVVRHPLYFGTFLVMVGLFAIFPTDAVLVIVCISTLYLIIGSRLEEQKLERHFGEAYRSYRRQVPMLFPWPRKHRRK